MKSNFTEWFGYLIGIFLFFLMLAGIAKSEYLNLHVDDPISSSASEIHNK